MNLLRRCSLKLWLPTLLLSATFSFAQTPHSTGLSIRELQHVDHLDEAAREPALIEHPDGTLFVAGYGSPDFQKPQTVPRLWKSTDRGATWERVSVGGEKDGALADSDVSLAVAPDGTIYYASMQFDLKTFEGVHIVIGVSKNAGQSWKWKMLSKKRYDDRPWVAVAPDGTAHAIWNDGSGVYHVTSHDGGANWSEPKMLYSDGGSSHLAVGPNGEVAVRIAPMSASGNKYTEGIDLIAVSTDGGVSWQTRAAPGKRDWAPMDTPGATPRWVEPLAWDSRGNLFSLWTDFKGVWLGRSSDRGVTWKSWKIAEPVALSYYPDLAAGSTGKLGATWFSGAGESLRWHACVISFEGSADQPWVAMSTPMEINSWTKTDEPDHVLVHNSAGEYVQPAFLTNGALAVVTPIQDPKENRYGFTFWKFDTK